MKMKKLLFPIGIVVGIFGNLIGLDMYRVALLTALFGVSVGLLNIGGREIEGFKTDVLVLFVIGFGSLTMFPWIGQFLTGVLLAITSLAGSAGITVALIGAIKKMME